MFKRRQLLATAGLATVSGLAGCSSLASNSESPDNSGGSNENTPENPIAAANPWRGSIAHFSGGSSPTEIRTAFDTDIPRILTAPAASLNTAFISTEDLDSIKKSVQEASLETEEVMNVSWNGGPVCDVQNYIQAPNDPTESTVREAFPNAISIFLDTSSREETWEIYTPQMDRSKLASGIEELGVSSRSSSLIYSSCSSADPTTSQDTPQTTAENSPTEAVRSYLTAIFSGDVQAANALIHPDGTVSEYTQEAAERNTNFNLTIDSIEVTEEGENTATVRTVVTLENPEADENMRRSQVYQLRIDENRWKVYAAEEDKAA